jgi:hypothetical protein
VKQGHVVVHRIKNRLDVEFDPTDAGEYRDILLNLSSSEKEGGHISELQLNLKDFIAVKNSGPL